MTASVPLRRRVAEAIAEAADEPSAFAFEHEEERVSIDGPPCHLCGAPGACGYDPEGRPYIHASWDEDETQEVR